MPQLPRRRRQRAQVSQLSNLLLRCRQRRARISRLRKSRSFWRAVTHFFVEVISPRRASSMSAPLIRGRAGGAANGSHLRSSFSRPGRLTRRAWRYRRGAPLVPTGSRSRRGRGRAAVEKFRDEMRATAMKPATSHATPWHARFIHGLGEIATAPTKTSSIAPPA
jgi:hypothetical protein